MTNKEGSRESDQRRKWKEKRGISKRTIGGSERESKRVREREREREREKERDIQVVVHKL